MVVRDGYEDDGLGDFELEQIGMQSGAFGGARLLKFNKGIYVTREGEVIEPSRPLVVLGLVKLVQKFVGQKLIHEATIIVPGDQKVPNIAALNEQAPREEWGVDFNGNPKGPYGLTLLLKLIDRNNTLGRFAFVTNSTGGSMAIGDLSARTKIMRQLRGPNIKAVVSCGVNNFKSTKFGLVKRPDFRTVDWIEFYNGEREKLPPTSGPTPSLPPASSAASTTSAAPAAAAPSTPAAPTAETAASPQGAAAKLDIFAGKSVNFGPSVKEPTLQEEMGGDQIPF
jgi:hypothetical protein